MTRNRLHPAIQRSLDAHPLSPMFVWAAIDKYAEAVLAEDPDVVTRGTNGFVNGDCWREIAQLFADSLANAED
jgi:hypothetical protein